MAIHNTGICTDVLNTQNYTNTETADTITFLVHDFKLVCQRKTIKSSENISPITSENSKLYTCKHLPEPGFTTT